MNVSDEYSFPLINGHCSIREASIHLSTDPAFSWLYKLFGRDPQRRSFLLVLFFGVPLSVFSAFLIYHGHLHAAVYPALVAAMFITSCLYCIGTSFPEKIPIDDVQTTVSHPPSFFGSQGRFTVHSTLNGRSSRTSIVLPYTGRTEQLALFRHALAVFDRAGIAVVNGPNRAA